MSWEEVIKRKGRRRIDFDFLNKVIIQEARHLKGQVLNQNEFDIFIEDVRDRYAKLHQQTTSDRIRSYIVKYLKKGNLLETKLGQQRIVIDGKFMGYKKNLLSYSFL